MASSHASGSKLAELEEKLKGLEEQKAALLKIERNRASRPYMVGRAEQGLGPDTGRNHSPVLW